MEARGLTLPFRRDQQRDFANAAGEELIRHWVMQALATEGASQLGAGELPWRTRFGAGLGRLRHRPADEVTRELARVLIRDALALWVPSVELRTVSARSEGERLVLRVQVRGRAGGPAVDVEVSP